MALARPILKALAAGLVLLAAAPAAAQAATPTPVVDAGARCSDRVPAAKVSARRPWCTVDHALKTVRGGTVLVRDGRYPAVAVTGLDRGRPVTLAAYPGEHPVVDGVTAERSAHLRIRGLVLTTGVLLRESRDVQVIGNEMRLTPAGPRTASGVILDRVDGVVVRGNWIHDGRDGVNVLGTWPVSRNVTVTANRFERLGDDAVHISMGEHMVVAGNRIDDVNVRADVDPAAHSDAMQVMGPTRDIVLRDNRVTGGRGFLVMVAPYRNGSPGQGHQGLVIAGNVFLGPQFGIRTFSTPGARIVNNTVWGTSVNPLTGLDLRDRMGVNDRSPGMVVTGNVVKQFDLDPGIGGLAVQAGNLIATGPRSAADLAGTPAFVAPAAGDVRLRTGSPGAGVAGAEAAARR